MTECEKKQKKHKKQQQQTDHTPSVEINPSFDGPEARQFAYTRYCPAHLQRENSKKAELRVTALTLLVEQSVQ